MSKTWSVTGKVTLTGIEASSRDNAVAIARHMFNSGNFTAQEDIIWTAKTVKSEESSNGDNKNEH